MRRLTFLAVLVVAVLLSGGAARAGAEITLYYHDPDVAVTKPAAFERRVAKLLGKLDKRIRLRVFARTGAMREAIRKEPPDFVMIPPYVAKDLGIGSEITPLLIRERRRSSFVAFVVIGTGALADLTGKTLAASGNAARPTVLDALLLSGTGVRSSQFRILETRKDIDAVLAAGRGQVACACVLEKSLNLVAKANPAVGAKLKVLHTIEEVPLAAVCAYKEPAAADVEVLERVLRRLTRSRNGKRLLRLLKTDRFVEVDGPLMEKLKP